MAVTTPLCQPGFIAPDFCLPDLDGRTKSLDQIRGPRATLIMFICNHCPYVQAIADRLARDCAHLAHLGVGIAAIMSNDVDSYPDDAPPLMARFAARHGFGFPYLYDHDQTVAQAYGAVCTPDFFGFSANLELCYRGRLDSSGRQAGPTDATRELVLAMEQIITTGHGPDIQIPSMGCSIKWRG